MKLKNFPLHNAKPRGAEQTRDYVKALNLKRNTEAASVQFANKNQSQFDLDTSEDGVVLNSGAIHTAGLGHAKLTGALSLDPERKVEYMQVDVVPDKFTNRTLSYEKDGEKVRYSLRYSNSDVVEHLVHDTATDTINYFLRTPTGQFVKE